MRSKIIRYLVGAAFMYSLIPIVGGHGSAFNFSTLVLIILFISKDLSDGVNI